MRIAGNIQPCLPCVETFRSDLFRVYAQPAGMGVANRAFPRSIAGMDIAPHQGVADLSPKCDP